MSMIQCERCAAFINSDDDPACFVEKPNYVNTAMPANPAWTPPIECEVVCESCREQSQ